MSSAMRQQARVHAGWLNSQAPPSTAAPPASSSLSDSISPSDHLTSAASAIKSQLQPLSLVPAPRSSSLAALMGQSQARPSVSSSSSSKGIALSNAAAATGHILKRALARRRKDSVDTAPSSPSLSSHNDGDAQVDESRVKDPVPRQPLSARQLASHLPVFGGKKFGKRPTSPLPPPPPPKPSPAFSKTPASSHPHHRSYVVPLSPSIASAVNFMRKTDDEDRERDTSALTQEHEKENNHDNQDATDLREDRRKSDSTMTARPGSHRASRPVSTVESLHSNHTVVPNSRRLSLLLQDMTVEATISDSVPDSAPPPSTRRPISGSGSKAQNRRSLSLNLGSPHAPSPSSPTSLSSIDVTLTSPALTPAPQWPTKLHPAATDTSHAAAAAAGSAQTASKNFRGRLTAWKSASQTASSSGQSQASTPDSQQPSSFHRQGVPSTSFRQATTSFSSNFAPAAGLAKRAVEKMGRAFGGITSSSSSGQSSTSTTSSPTSQSSFHTSDQALSRRDSPQSTRATIDKAAGKTPGVSLSSVDFDAFLNPDGPSLGKQLRAPLRLAGGGAGVAGGLVFGRDLSTCCRETAIRCTESPSRRRDTTANALNETEFIESLETRMVPAIVVRSVQHLFLWGVHEEGLFRVNGRPFHVSKLRGEFDTGCDYDMSQCGPGDLDPHAVASVFKAYLRELPEPILTRELLPQFEVAINSESAIDRNQKSPLLGRGNRGPSLPTGPRNGLTLIRKPPSLSTLALPNFSTSKPPSPTLVKALRSLILRLPEENRDLIRIVTLLIKSTAKHSKETKMPLSNLLLVFCPSLNMTPPLLRALCECEGIWEAAPHSPAEPDGADVQTLPPKNDAKIDTALTDAVVSHFSDAPSGVNTTSKESEPAGKPSTLRTRITARQELVPTIYLDSESCPSSSLGLSVGTESSSSTDDVSFVSTSEEPMKDPSCLENWHADSPPPLSPSTDSLVTPSTSSFPTLPTLVSKPQLTSAPSSPVIGESTNLPLPPKLVVRSPISSPVQFPLTGPNHAAPSPSRRRSIPSLAVPRLSFQSENSMQPPLSLTDQDNDQHKKPTLNLLFVKNSGLPSATSLISFSPYGHGWSASDSSTSTPTSAVTAQSNSSAANLTPVLNTSIDSSPLGLELPRDGDGDVSKLPPRDSSQIRTPIADMFRSPAVSMRSRHSSGDPGPVPAMRALQPPQALRPRRSDISSNNRLGEPVKVDDDWTRGVLLAADMNTGWLSSHHGGLTAAPVH